MRTAALLLALLGASCGTPGRNVPVDLVPAPSPRIASLVARQVGRLLSADPRASREAERLLTTLDEPGRAALRAHAERIPAERDPRWLHVLEENQALPPLPPEVELEFALWKASREEPLYAMKGQDRLLSLARREPDLLLERLQAGGTGTEAVAVALAVAGEHRAVPVLLARYEGARSDYERRMAAEALGRLAGEALRPRGGSLRDVERDVEAIRAWYREQERERDQEVGRD